MHFNHNFFILNNLIKYYPFKIAFLKIIYIIITLFFRFTPKLKITF